MKAYSFSFTLILISVLLIWACGKEEATEPPTTGKISGLVYDATSGIAIEQARVFTVPPSSAVTTDTEGGFMIENLEPGTFKVYAYKIGYDSADVDVSVSAGNTTIADIALTAADTTAAP